uniref:Acidic nuclear phosphoprotein 32 family member E n=1 Tax=Mus musculus TaxID=10090 RepID=E9PVI5_MOUSE
MEMKKKINMELKNRAPEEAMKRRKMTMRMKLAQKWEREKRRWASHT